MNAIKVSLRPTEPLRAEHRELRPSIEQLLSTADGVGSSPPGEVAAAVDEALGFLEARLVPHARAEEAVLYPLVEELMAAPGATATMRRDHLEIVSFAGRLRALRPGVGATGGIAEVDPRASLELRRVLYGLHAIIELHFAKEEELYLETLDAALTPERAVAFVAALESAADAARTA